jgi:DNA-binding CsgD family transcriptional regulator
MSVSALRPRERDALRAAVDAIRVLDVTRHLDASELARRVTSSLHDLLDAPAVTLHAERTEQGWGFDILESHGLAPELVSSYERTVARNPTGFFQYNPLRPAPQERNVVRDVVLESDKARAFFSVYGYADHAQSRVLVCDGPLLLAWIGAFRRSGVRDARDHACIRAIARAARGPLRLARSFGRTATTALEAAFEAYPGEIYLARRSGHVELANECGSSRLLQQASVIVALRESIAAHPTAHGEFEIQPVRGGMGRDLFLATRSRCRTSALVARIAATIDRWKLTRREGQVLACLMEGDANKDIAIRLAMSIRTVEQHVATILARARVESRLRLVAKVWNES